MPERPISITDQRYLTQCIQAIQNDPDRLWQSFITLDRQPTISFSFSASAVYSSNIEGVNMDLNSFMRSKRRGKASMAANKERREIEALEEAYAFAQKHVPNEKNVLKAHALLSRTFLPNALRGVYRTSRMFVYGRTGIIYAAVEWERVPKEMNTFFEELRNLRNKELTVRECFYHAALIHLVLAQIHPFEDGNGRTARLLEKWFLSAVLGDKAWKIPSEEYYFRHRPTYYKTINLGPNFYMLDYDCCVHFLQLLPKALRFAQDNAEEQP